MRAIYCIILLLSCVKLSAVNTDSLFFQANNFYSQEEYDSSIRLYDSILKLGYESEEIYFNLGNCYYLKGNMPKSILNYEKSLVLNPKNLDAKANLEITHKRISLLEKLPKLIIYQWWECFTNALSLKAWTILVLFLIWLICLVIYLFFFYKRKIIFKAILLITILNTVSICALKSKINSSNNVYGILNKNSTLYEQSDINSNKSNVGQGNKALIILEKEDWIFVRFSNGLEGWLKTENLLTI